MVPPRMSLIRVVGRARVPRRGHAWYCIYVMERISPMRHDGALLPLRVPPFPRQGGTPAGPLAHVAGTLPPPMDIPTYEGGGDPTLTTNRHDGRVHVHSVGIMYMKPIPQE